MRWPRTSTLVKCHHALGRGQDWYTIPAVFKGTCIVTGEKAQDFNARDVAKTLWAVATTGRHPTPAVFGASAS